MSEYQIVIADRGWVYVGKVARIQDLIVITDCYNIRRWGTAGGLGELALNGPTGDTVLDFYGTVRVHVLALPGGEVECDDAVWSSWMARNMRARK